MEKIRYPRTTLEICDVTLDVLRSGIGLGFACHYPELTCYNGRRWQEGMNRCSLYYIRSYFQAWFLESSGKPAGAQGFDVRMAVIRNSNEGLNNGLPFFWCSVWYKTGAVRFVSKPPEQYRPEIHLEHYHCPRWSSSIQDKVSKFDPEFHFPDLKFLCADKPPHPIQF